MRICARVCLLSALIVCGAGPTHSQDVQIPPPDVKPPKAEAWEVVTSPEGRFAVSFPSRPTARVSTVETATGPLTFHEWVLSAAPHFRFAYVDYPESIEAPERVKQVLDATRDGRVRQVKGTLLEEKEVSLEGHPGRYAKVRAGDGQVIRSRNYAVGNRGYFLMFTTRDDATPAAYDETAARFFDSFKLLPAEDSARDTTLEGGRERLPDAPKAVGEVDRMLNDRSLRILVGSTGSEQSEGRPAAASPGMEGRILNGRAVQKPPPAYPALARAARAQGTVAVKVIVDEEGKVIAAQADSGHPLLQGSAVKAAREARFEPTLLDGKPVKIYGLITYNFVLQ